MTKTRKDNDVTERISAVYGNKNIKLSWLIVSGVVYDENQIRQQRDQSIGLVYIETKTKLSRPSNRVRSMMKTR